MEKSAVTCDDEVSFLTHFSDIIYFGFTGERRDGDVLSKNGNKPIFFFSISTHNNDIVCIQEQDFVDEFTLQCNLHP